MSLYCSVDRDFFWHLTPGIRRGWKRSWVRTRRSALRSVSSSSPFRTVLATFIAHGSTPLVSLHGETMKRLFPFRRHPQGRSPVFHPISPTCTRDILVNSLRVRWVLCSSLTICTSSFQRLGAFAISTHPGVRGFPTLRLLRPIRHFLRHRSFVGVSLTYFPLSFTSFRKLPVFVMEDSNRMR